MATRGAAAVELLGIEQGLHGEAAGGRVHAPFDWVERAAAGAAPTPQRLEAHRLRPESLRAGCARLPPGTTGPQRAAVVVALENKIGELGTLLAKLTTIDWFNTLGESVTIVTGLIFMICVLAFRRGIMGEIVAWLERRGAGGGNGH